ncbi:hypothetical protein I312_105407 [Cryptococcus bacillisporus CA1280]|uniref:uncharacterized protein n=1 Tax=Cryptococcus bacillisporus CA1280 TaxID=1296109 RepID=UPI0033692974
MPPTTITYTLHPTPSHASSSSSVLHNAVAGIKAHLPLRNLHWKSSSRTSLRTIQEIDIDIVDLGEATSLRDKNTSVLDSPLVNMCLVVCEDGEVYKSQTRNFIRDWLSLLAARRTPHAPLIVLVNPPNSAADKSGKTVWGKDKGVLGKLKADFNVGKHDRCVQLNLPPPGVNDPAAWPELINKLKECFVSAFDAAILEREDEVKRGEAQRVMVGWNFCTWFLLKESLAQSFEAVNLPGDSLIIYEELEAAFIQVVKEQNLSWFGKLGATGPRDDSLPILNTTMKPYREMLRTSSISVFDFRVYLFARQGILLGKLGRITEVAKRGQWFVASLAKRLRENEADLAEHFIESWTYTACMDIVSKCDQWARLERPNNDYSGLTAYESVRSELLDIARIQVEHLGVSSGHLPSAYPFQPPSAPQPASSDVLFDEASLVSSSPSSPVVPTDSSSTSRPQISNSILQAATADRSNFFALYRDLTLKVIAAYRKCAKNLSCIRPLTNLLGLAVILDQWEEVYTQAQELARECQELGVWDRVVKYVLGVALKAAKKLDKGGMEWGELAIGYLEVSVRETGKTGDEDEDMLLKEVIEGLKKVDGAWSVEGHRLFSIRLLGKGTKIDHNEITIDVEVTNELHVDVENDRVEVRLDHPHSGGVIIFSAKEITLHPGINLIRLSSSTSTHGIYNLQSASLFLGQFSFNYDLKDSGRSVIIRRDEGGLRITLRMPYDIKLIDDNLMVLDIKSGRIDLREVRVNLTSLTRGVGFILEGAKRDGTNFALNDEGLITVGDIRAGETMTISVPYTGLPPTDYMRAHIDLQYSTDKGARQWMDVQTVDTGLPLTINVQDFFRPDCLLSHFTVSPDDKEILRIASAELIAPDGSGYEVESCRKQGGDPIVSLANQPLSFLFKIRRKKDGDPTSSLSLRIRYRQVDEEIRSSVTDVLRSLSPSSRASIERAVYEILADRSKWRSYLIGESLEGIFCHALKNMGNSGLAFCESIKSVTLPKWRTLEIPVDVPQRRLLTAISLVPTLPPSTLIYQGRPLAFLLKLSTSSQWMGLPSELTEEEKIQRLVYDVQVNPEDWIVWGKKKAYFVPDPEKDVKVEIVLLPTRAGTIFLPNVSIYPLHSPDGSSELQAKVQGVLCESYMENAAQTVRVLPAKKEVTVLVPAPLPGGAPIGEQWEGVRA